MKYTEQEPRISIEKAILADLCLGIPLGKIALDIPEHLQECDISLDDQPETYLFRGEQLAVMKRLYQKGHASVVDAVSSLVAMADEACKTSRFSVTDKPNFRFSDNPHDYQSLAKYAWPADGQSESEKPFVLRDGEVNPDCYSDDFDYVRLVRFSDTVVLLSIAAYLTGRHSYADRASRLCRIWFLNDDTFQTPHFAMSQVLPGSTRLRWAGIIEARFFVYVTEAIRLLDACEAFNESEQKGLRSWFSDFLDWIQQSEQGQAARNAKNNIGFWYDLQCMVYADFCGRDAECEEIIHQAVLPRLERQMACDGSFPEELTRAYPHDYVVFSLAAMALISRGAEKVGISLWDSKQSDGRNFQAAHDWLLKAANASSLLAHIRFSDSRSIESFHGLGPILDMGIEQRAILRIVDARTTKLKKLESEYTLLQQEQLKGTSENTRLQREIDNIKSSTSWRITRPLRFVLQVARRSAEKNWFKTVFSQSVKPPENVSLSSDIKSGFKQYRKALFTKAGIFRHVRTFFPAASVSDPLTLLTSHQPPREKRLMQEYRHSELAKMPDTFVLYRIIGNDLVPRHKKGQSRKNLRFVLENEPALPNCEKRWVVNRIFDQDEERRVIAMLEEYRQPYIHIPFDVLEYRQIGWDFDALPEPGYLNSKAFLKLGPEQQGRLRTALYRLKNNYVMHNNGARNTALRDGFARAKWVLPWDGNCFLTSEAWREISHMVTQRAHLSYFAVPMDRITDNALLLRPDYKPNPVEEPQLLFRCDADEMFNEDYPYGRRPKVELFWRLGIPGPWDRWKNDPWDQPRRSLSPEKGRFGVAGWVARMYSGVKSLETEDKAAFKNRGIKRQEAIIAAIGHIDAQVHADHSNPLGLTFYNEQWLTRAKQSLLDSDNNALQKSAQQLLERAEQILSEGPYSVTQKSALPPSGDIHDYWHPAPYWWPDPDSPDGLPYIRKDGQRVPGTRMYEPQSAKYDRTRLQLMLDGTTTMALAWYLTGREDFARHGASLLRTWFLNPETRMNPHLRYAQVRMGHNNNEGSPSGIIEFKDIYYFLDAVRLLERSEALSLSEIKTFKIWLHEYLNWLETSRQGEKEKIASNNHGTYFDLQAGAITVYLNESEKFRDVMFRALSRIPQQFSEAGEQPEEMRRTTTQHYCFFNLQGWLNIIRLAQASGFPLGQYSSEPLRRIARSCQWVLQHDQTRWPYEQIEPFDTDRQYPLSLMALVCSLSAERGVKASGYLEKKTIFNPHDAVAPYWNVGVAIE